MTQDLPSTRLQGGNLFGCKASRDALRVVGEPLSPKLSCFRFGRELDCLYVALTFLYMGSTVLCVALTVLPVALLVLYMALTVLDVALTVVHVALTVLYVPHSVDGR
jgi:hypothetical protein